MYKCMTNKNFFISLKNHPLVLGDFEVVSYEITSNFIPSVPRNTFWNIVVKFKGKFLPFNIRVNLSKRSIITDIQYAVPELCKFSPYELREWCPAIFLPYTNYLHWKKFFRIALEIYVESNPNIYVLFE